MKKHIIPIVAALCVALASLTSCAKNSDWTDSCRFYSTMITEYTSTSVTVAFLAETPDDGYPYKIGLCVADADKDPKTGGTEADVTCTPGTNNYKVTLTGLTPGTSYSFRGYISCDDSPNRKWGDKFTFTTVSEE